MIIYGSSFSPFVRKTMAFATEKGLAFKLKALRPDDTPEAFLQASPFGKMPGFQDGDFLISDSTAIVTYLDTLHPDPNLIPTEARARARTIWFEEFADTMIATCGTKIFFNRVVSPRFLGQAGDLAMADEAEQIEMPRLIDYLEGAIPVSGYLVEDRFTLADIAVASPFATLSHASRPVDASRWPKVAAYLDAILARPSFADTLAREKRLLSAVA
jgi:glutathione S-transferase